MSNQAPFAQLQRWIDNYSYSSLETAGFGLGALAACTLVFAFKKLVVDPNLSSLKVLPGPKGFESIIWGHLPQIFKAPAGVIHEAWAKEFGNTFQYRGFFLARRLCTMDTRAIAHILNHSADYPKPDQIRGNLEKMFGKGVLFAEGEDHRRQRRIMNPCFGITQIRGLVPVFYDKAYQLRDIWIHELAKGSASSIVKDDNINVMFWLTRATLDIIGSAGFDYEFNSLVEGETNELAHAFNAIFSNQSRPTALTFLQNRFPILRFIATKQIRDVDRSTQVMHRIGRRLLEEKKTAVLGALQTKELESKDLQGRDLLTMLVKANMAIDAKESQKMTDEEVLAQISTFLIAGHETTSSSITWLLYTLASSPNGLAIQQKLRAELESVKSSRPTMEELNSLPYLDAVIRENLRLNAVVTGTVRVADKDDVLPLNESYIDSNGVERTEVKVAKGDTIFLSILSLHRDKRLWGEDALEFKPERWIDGETPTDIPGVFAGLLTFLGGPRACIGYRFALMEMKALMFVLLRDFSFEWTNPTFEVEPRSSIVTRPLVKRPSGENAFEMPLKVRALQAS